MSQLVLRVARLALPPLLYLISPEVQLVIPGLIKLLYRYKNIDIRLIFNKNRSLAIKYLGMCIVTPVAVIVPGMPTELDGVGTDGIA